MIGWNRARLKVWVVAERLWGGVVLFYRDVPGCGGSVKRWPPSGYGGVWFFLTGTYQDVAVLLRGGRRTVMVGVVLFDRDVPGCGGSVKGWPPSGYGGVRFAHPTLHVIYRVASRRVAVSAANPTDQTPLDLMPPTASAAVPPAAPGPACGRALRRRRDARGSGAFPHAACLR